MACDSFGGVSKNGSMPWPTNKTDLRWFKNNTINSTVVMGSSTWNDPDMPTPLPNRHNIVVTSNPDSYPVDTISGNISNSIPKDCWIIGGPNIIDQTWDIIEEFYLTRIPGNYYCDIFLDLTNLRNCFTIIESITTNSVTFQIWRKDEAIS